MLKTIFNWLAKFNTPMSSRKDGKTSILDEKARAELGHALSRGLQRGDVSVEKSEPLYRS